MKIDYQRWDKNGYVIEIGGRAYVVAPEDLAFDGDNEETMFWHQDDAREVNHKLASGWTIPTREQMICIAEAAKRESRLNIASYPYWVDDAEAAYSPCSMKSVPIFEINEGITCHIRCICDLHSLME